MRGVKDDRGDIVMLEIRIILVIFTSSSIWTMLLDCVDMVRGWGWV